MRRGALPGRGQTSHRDGLHCRDCRYLSGGAEANVVVPRSAFALTSGEDRTYRSEAASGAGVWRSFCPTGGAPHFAGNDRHPEVVPIKLGTLDDPAWFKRQGHIWVGSAPPWHLIEPDLPKAERNPEFL